MPRRLESWPEQVKHSSEQLRLLFVSLLMCPQMKCSDGMPWIVGLRNSASIILKGGKGVKPLAQLRQHFKSPVLGVQTGSVLARSSSSFEDVC